MKVTAIRTMFKKLFFKKKRTIDSLIRDIADHQRPDDYSEFFRRLPTLQLFIPIVGPLPASIPSGERIVIRAGMEIKARTALVQDLECVLAFTSNDNPNLGNDYAGIEGREALQMVLRIPNMGGLLVQSTGTGVALDRQKVSHVLSMI